MSDTGGNNSNINQSVNNSPNSLQNSQNPETSNNYGNQSNNMNPYNSGGYGGYGSSFGSSYGSGYGSGYGSSYGSGFGSGYGSGYGSSYGSYGSGYGSSYGSSYGSGYSSYGPNQYSNTYSKPMQQGQGQQNQQAPPPNFRHDVWGFLNGFHAILNVLYAGTGIVHFGKMFLKMSIKIIKAVFGKSAGLVYKLTGFQFLKNIMQKFSNKGDWLGEFNVGEAPLENLWANNGPESANTNRTFFGKFMLVLRILSLMGGIVSFFLRKKVSASQNQQPPVQIEFVDNEIPQVQLRPDEPVVGIEGIKSFYDEVKLIEQDHAEELRDTDSMKEVIEEVNEEVKSEIQQTLEKEEEKSEVASPRSVVISEVEEKTLEKLNEDETNPIAIISTTEEVVTLTPEMPMPSQGIFMPQVSENQESAAAAKIVTETQPAKEQIVSEDFWKNEEVFKKIESIQKENAQQSETKQDTFELPSVLKTLRSSSSNATKPWLMKKKKNPEPAPEQEAPVQTLAESTTLPSETITPEMPSSEAKKENSEVVEVSSAIENPLEGTA